MVTKPRLSAAALAGALILGAAPVQAAMPMPVTVSAAMPLAAIGLAQAGCGPSAAAPSPAVPFFAAAPMTKASAILGGQVSALDRIRMQQSGGEAAAASPASTRFAPALPVAGGVLPAAAVGFACSTAALPLAAPVASGRRAGGPFLGASRIKIGRTHFDREWKRVAARTLSARDLAATLGTVPGERGALLDTVNRQVNARITYRSDGAEDRWSDARATLRARAGDCEDYAILKMQLLAAAGVRREDMLLTLARDTMRRADHAVLLVRHGDGWVVLDNQGDGVVPADGRLGYRPVMSFGKSSSWLHGYTAEQQPVRVAIAR